MKKIFFIVIFLFLSVVENKAQCPAGFNYGGSQTIWISTGCYMTYEYCWRTILDNNMNPVFYDAWIGAISFRGVGCAFQNEFDLNPEHFQELAMNDIVGRLNPWGAFIPICPQQSAVRYRMGTVKCYSKEWVQSWDTEHTPNGDIQVPVVTKYPCYTATVSFHQCYESQTYCWFYNSNNEWKLLVTYGTAVTSDRDCEDPVHCMPACK